MGYEYTTIGWCKTEAPIDLDAVTRALGELGTREPAMYWCRVLGRNRNYLLFGTEAKWRVSYYLKLLAAIPGLQTGLLTVYGEISFEGKDRFILVEGPQFFTLPLSRLYMESSPWYPLYRQTHYLVREPEKFSTPDYPSFDRTYNDKTSVKAWIHLPDYYVDDAAQKIVDDLISRDTAFAGSVSFLNQYSELYLLIAQDNAVPVATLQQLTDLTARFPESFGVAYFASADERQQIPVALGGGKIMELPAISLSPQDEPRLFITNPDAYQGLDSASSHFVIQTPLEIAAVRQILRDAARVTATPSQKMIEHNAVNAQTSASGVADNDSFVESDLLVQLSPARQDTKVDPAKGQALEVWLKLDGEASPEHLRHRARAVAEKLRDAGFHIVKMPAGKSVEDFFTKMIDDVLTSENSAPITTTITEIITDSGESPPPDQK